MDNGMILIAAALLATAVSAWNYYSAFVTQRLRRPDTAVFSARIRTARLGFYAMTGLVSLASGVLLYLIFSHSFQVEYVYRYTSRDLPFGYLLSAFWAGQEGSFLLWALLIALMGTVFIRTTRHFEAPAMLVVNAVQAGFLIILMKASPFTMMAQLPPDGAGLNPLLQNPWMVIHPPVLFIGYAAATFPFALAVAALLRRDYEGFVPQALPWSLIVSITLGAGIIIGGYWAYKVLGWGGYWGWDPVENSSLIPWLTTLALLHGLLVQKALGAFSRSNLFLAIVTFGLVLYATFLTRSGVLADFSVHSFQDLGINLYLIAFIAITLGGGLYLLVKRAREVPFRRLEALTLNRETILLASMLVFAASAVFTFLGTSSPLFTGLMGRPAQVDIAFYNRIHLPIAIGMGLLLGFAPLLRWRTPGRDGLFRDLLPSIALTLLTVAAAVYLGTPSPTTLMLLGSATFALGSNAVVTVRLLASGWRNAGAPLAHFGVALLLTGIVVSGTFADSRKIVLEEGRPGAVYNYRMTYHGMTPAANGKDRMAIDVASDAGGFKAEPRFYFSEFNKSVMAEPAVHANALYDLYISPLERRPGGAAAGDARNVILNQGEPGRVGAYQVLFEGFDMANHSDGGTLRAGARLVIRDGNAEVSVVPAIVMERSETRPEPASFTTPGESGGHRASVTLNRIDADRKAVEVSFVGMGAQAAPSPSTETVVLDVSRKPFMGVLWLGTMLLTAGSGLALWRRRTLIRPLA